MDLDKELSGGRNNENGRKNNGYAQQELLNAASTTIGHVGTAEGTAQGSATLLKKDNDNK
jgi:hypothetical protein